MLPDRRRSRGFSAISAVAILIILALLGAFIVSISTVQQQASALDLLGSRAYHAAKAGIEWGAYQVLHPEDTGAARYAGCDAPLVANLSGLGGLLSEFTVRVECQMYPAAAPFYYPEFGRQVRVYQLTATACNLPSGGTCPNNAAASPAYVERQVVSVIATCRQVGGAPC
jgi:MSHA biogenesis protein MshP